MRENATAFLPEALRLAVPEIDSQHEALFSELATLKAICLETNRLPPEKADILLAKLHDHFATEERLAREAMVYFSEHAQKHQEMLLALGKAFAEAREGKRDVFSLLRYVDYWFELHIAGEDRQLASRLHRARGEQVTAAARPTAPGRSSERHPGPPSEGLKAGIEAL